MMAIQQIFVFFVCLLGVWFSVYLDDFFFLWLLSVGVILLSSVVVVYTYDGGWGREKGLSLSGVSGTGVVCCSAEGGNGSNLGPSGGLTSPKKKGGGGVWSYGSPEEKLAELQSELAAVPGGVYKGLREGEVLQILKEVEKVQSDLETEVKKNLLDCHRWLVDRGSCSPFVDPYEEFYDLKPTMGSLVEGYHLRKWKTLMESEIALKDSKPTWGYGTRSEKLSQFRSELATVPCDEYKGLTEGELFQVFKGVEGVQCDMEVEVKKNLLECYFRLVEGGSCSVYEDPFEEFDSLKPTMGALVESYHLGKWEALKGSRTALESSGPTWFYGSPEEKLAELRLELASVPCDEYSGLTEGETLRILKGIEEIQLSMEVDVKSNMLECYCRLVVGSGCSVYADPYKEFNDAKPTMKALVEAYHLRKWETLLSWGVNALKYSGPVWSYGTREEKMEELRSELALIPLRGYKEMLTSREVFRISGKVEGVQLSMEAKVKKDLLECYFRLVKGGSGSVYADPYEAFNSLKPTMKSLVEAWWLSNWQSMLDSKTAMKKSGPRWFSVHGNEMFNEFSMELISVPWKEYGGLSKEGKYKMFCEVMEVWGEMEVEVKKTLLERYFRMVARGSCSVYADPYKEFNEYKPTMGELVEAYHMQKWETLLKGAAAALNSSGPSWDYGSRSDKVKELWLELISVPIDEYRRLSLSAADGILADIEKGVEAEMEADTKKFLLECHCRAVAGGGRSVYADPYEEFDDFKPTMGELVEAHHMSILDRYTG